ncbi:thiolase family protein [Rubrobacter marinus]|uniref:propanoyl-CoA C-acyltransferase n=1 Tax=Rubrobacter marinus TaxID=2653852 RepID=A0A6G8PSM6_9ACTN|nr:thiolase family protein [Rubrobacter marinus]QIN77489.1 thiolase family protein [Rubrobacter marinus]
MILRHVGLSGIPVVNVENACASGATALHQAAMAVGSGAAETALALGVEKLFVGDTKRSLRALGTSTDVETMGDRGGQFTALYAMKARQVMEDYGIPIESVARVAVKNSRNGSLNPIAQFRKPRTIESVLSSRPISEPLTLLMCSSIADGAAAALLVSERKAREMGIPKPVYVAGCGLRSGEYGRREGLAEANSVRAAAHRAYDAAGIGPEDLDLLEVHDAAASSEVDHLASLGVAPVDRGYRELVAGRYDLHGELPVNTSGGLLSRGHPTGATGVAQVGEVVLQLRGSAGERQARGGRPIRTGLCLNTGGRVEDDRAAIAVTVLST